MTTATRNRIQILYAFVLSFLFFFVSSSGIAQTGPDDQLANHYFSQGEYSKAKDYYEKLYKQEPIHFYFDRYYQCLAAENDVKNMEKLLKNHLNATNGSVEVNVMLAQFYDDNGENAKADKIYKSLLDNLKPNPSAIISLFNAFKAKGKNDLAYQTIVKGRNMLKNSYPLNFQFAEYYGAVQEPRKMIQEYIDLIAINEQYLSTVQNFLIRIVDFNSKNSENYIALKSELLARIQNNPDNLAITEMLTWMFIQSKDFGAALMQEQAIDKRMEFRGRRVYELGVISAENKDYTTARKAFSYVKNLGEGSPFYFNAENSLLNTRYLEITTARNVSSVEIDVAIEEYQAALNRIGQNGRSVPLIIELAHIQAFYNDNSNKAIELLNGALEIQRLTDIQRAEIKMKLGDIHVLHGDIWEASLYYMQIDKDFKHEPIGHEARFKNARIFYYDGEFNYAQSQLDVLKQATTKLIANDALELSLLITDNFGLDSNFQAMFWFASADLLIEQHKYELAFQLFDSIIATYPYHSLGDEILIRKSKAMQQQGKWEEAISYLDELLKYHGDDILADDAWFIKGDIYQNHLFNTEKAMDCYKEILFKFKGSLHATEARKRFRELRGDVVKEVDEL